MKHNRLFSPFRIIIMAYTISIGVGGLLLYWPVSQQPGVSLSFMDAVFTATSAVTVTGLTVVNVSETFSPFGILILGLLIQLGGIGIMSVGTLIWLATGQRINLSQRLLIMVDQNQFKFSGLVYLVKNMLGLVICIQLAGAFILGLYFLNYFDSWREAFVQGVFTSLSAFTNSGFDLTGDSLRTFAHDYFVQGITMSLIIMGAIGFPVLVELKEYWQNRPKEYRFSLFTKVAVRAYLVLMVLGMLFIWLLEREHAYAGLSWLDQFFYSLFHSVTARSAGLATIDVTQFGEATLLFISGLMMIGANPSSAGGGIRTTTLAIMFLTILAFARGRKEVHIFGRELHQDDIRRAFIVLSLFIVIWFCSIILIIYWEKDVGLLPILFEVSSAMGTCGLSLGITPALSIWSKWILMVLMFIGRIGIVVLLFSMKKTESVPRYHYPKERIIIG